MILKDKQRILFQGDSITDAERTNTLHGLGQGYVFIIVSWLKAIYYKYELEFLNRGVSGNTILDLNKRWYNDCILLKPDIVSILIGINDCNKNIPNEIYQKNYDEILKLSKEKLKGVKFVLLEPFVLEVNSYFKKLKKSVDEKAQIVRSLSKKYDGILVPLNVVFSKLSKLKPPQYWAEDGVHPTLQGHFIIAKEFLKAIKAIR